MWWLPVEEFLSQHRHILLERLDTRGEHALAGEQFVCRHCCLSVALHQLSDLALKGDKVLGVDVDAGFDPTLPLLYLHHDLVKRGVGERGVNVDRNATLFCIAFWSTPKLLRAVGHIKGTSLA